jgi:hypothetical protein
LVFEFPVIHQSAHRRAGGSGNFNQIYIEFTGHAQSFSQTDDAQGFVVGAADADFRGRDLSVQAVFAFLALATVAKFSSDGDYPCSKKAARFGKQQHTGAGTRPKTEE